MSVVASKDKQGDCIDKFDEVVLGNVLNYAALNKEATTKALKCNLKDK